MNRIIKRFWRLYQGFIVSLALLVFTFVGVLVGILPVVRSSIDMLDLIQKLESRTQVLSTKQRFLDTLDEVSVRKNLQILLSAVPSGKDVPSVLATTDSLVSGSGLGMIDMSITNLGSIATEAATRKSDEEKRIGSSLLPFTLTVEGNLTNFKDFLTRSVAIRRLVRVRSFTAIVTTSGAIQVNINLDAFYNPLPKALGSVDQPLPVATDEEQALLTRITSYPWASQSLVVSSTVSTSRTNPFSQ